jgi:hypothetical protein
MTSIESLSQVNTLLSQISISDQKETVFLLIKKNEKSSRRELKFLIDLVNIYFRQIPNMPK